MAAAEARAAWQRTANGCFVQEDAKRAPKLACCPSSSSSSKPQVDAGSGDAAQPTEQPIAGFVPLNWNSSNSNLPPDTRWWLQLQPNYVHQKDFTREHTHQPLKQKDLGEYWCRDKDLDFDPLNRFLSKEPHKLFDWESPWNGSEKTEPWWRAVDKDDLAYLVAQKSLDHIENCDLPPPQNMNVIRSPFSCFECFEKDKNFLHLSLDREVSTGYYSRSCLTCSKENGKRWSHSEQRPFPYGTEKPFSLKPIRSASSTYSHSSTNNDPPETVHTSGSEPSKAELLEALRHSQTRAREAEKAAQQAYNEKEHIIKLFFRQASHLFAYKQWLQILQLETLCLQLKNKDQPISSLFPVLLPWMPYKAGRRVSTSPRRTSMVVAQDTISVSTLSFLQLAWVSQAQGCFSDGLWVGSYPCSSLNLTFDFTVSWLCNLEVDYGSAENASIVYAALAVDKEDLHKGVTQQQAKIDVQSAAIHGMQLIVSHPMVVAGKHHSKTEDIQHPADMIFD
ncbi:hypothetical protein Sjap_025982 [Stephania japonica]|uniref:Uncharacterized protein n=1 Tax=Stephania japonica TaxID=461633 RepID=A0AAP0E2R6_9MAGN